MEVALCCQISADVDVKECDFISVLGAKKKNIFSFFERARRSVLAVAVMLLSEKYENLSVKLN